MTFPLSKTLDPADFEELAPELSLVDRHFTKEREQHPMRRWEYAMALRALTDWRFQSHRTEQGVYDIGGAGSPFCWMLPGPAIVVDPEADISKGWAERLTLDQFVRDNPRLADVTFCLSVLEHVDDLDRFLYHLGCLVAPGGLLFLTMDYCDDFSEYAYPKDTYHFHWMRKRIFNAYSLGSTISYPLLQRDFQPFGAIDLTWHGAHVFDYSFCSLALVKRP